MMNVSSLHTPLHGSIMSGTRVFGKGQGRVLHFSNRAINLLFDDNVVTLLNRRGILSPSTIIVDIEAFPPIEWAEFLRNILITDRFRVYVSNSVDLSIREQSEVDGSNIVRLLRPFLTLKERSISRALLMLYGISCCSKGFEKAVMERQFRVLRDSRTLEVLTQNLLGLGFGLTPSGDDFIIGVISIFNLLNKEETTRLRSIISSYNNPFSRTILLNALDGYYSQPLYAFLQSIINGSLSEVQITNLIKIGNTSGLDMLAGIYYTLDIGYVLKTRI